MSQNYGMACKYVQSARTPLPDKPAARVLVQRSRSVLGLSTGAKDGPGGGSRTHTVLSTTGF